MWYILNHTKSYIKWQIWATYFSFLCWLFYIRDMCDTHYIIFCHPKRQLIIVF